ncbi:SOS response-associated peptidase [Radiobacillus sp. PE A8.2]|uniref:SOS response-associated peptidase n=1 Tax=Radiobacillus sp. PE A8.2 TaxID=3380349 RepID=UPI00388D4F01
MCGRFTLHAEDLEILKEYDLTEMPNYDQRYNIAPGQKVLAIIHDGKQKRAGYLTWGLVPAWSKDLKIGFKMINARSETAHQKPSFKRLMSQKRCLIVADSFYEWERLDKGKQAKRIALKNRHLFAFAGLWDKWEHEGEELYTCTVLTRAANTFMQPIHDRMPVILPKEKENEWIEPLKRDPNEVYQFIQGLDIDPLEAYDVSDYVNSSKNEGQACIAPLI